MNDAEGGEHDRERDVAGAVNLSAFGGGYYASAADVDFGGDAAMGVAYTYHDEGRGGHDHGHTHHDETLHPLCSLLPRFVVVVCRHAHRVLV